MGEWVTVRDLIPKLLKLGCESVPKLRSLQTALKEKVCLLAANTWTGNRLPHWKLTNEELEKVLVFKENGLDSS